MLNSEKLLKGKEGDGEGEGIVAFRIPGHKRYPGPKKNSLLTLLHSHLGNNFISFPKTFAFPKLLKDKTFG